MTKYKLLKSIIAFSIFKSSIDFAEFIFFYFRTSTELTFFFEPEAAARCGTVREEEGVYSNVVVVQYHPVIQRKGDR